MNRVKVISSNYLEQLLTVEWKLDNFCAISAKEHKSRTFVADFCKSYEWYISVDLDDGEIVPNAGQVGVFLFRQNERNKAVVSFETKLLSEKRVLIASETSKCDFKVETNWGFCDMKEIDSLKEEIEDGALIIRMEISYEHIADPLMAKLLHRVKANASMIDNDTTDFKIVVMATGQEIGIHKTIMSMGWPHFKTMLATPMDESMANKWDIADFDYKTMKAIVLFMYTDYFEVGSVKEAMEVMKAAHKYKIDELLKLTEEYVSENVEIEHVFEVLVTVDLFGMQALRAKCFDKLVKAKRASTADFNLGATPGYEQFRTHASAQFVMDFFEELFALL